MREGVIIIISRCLIAALFASPLSCATAVSAQDAPDAFDAAEPVQSATLTPAELFDFADRARDGGDFATAEAAYRALATNPAIEIRNEARFRLALMLADRRQDHAGAAVLLRQILDEQPDVARVRLELARMQALLGNLGAAARELRAAQAAGLPPEVERLVRFYASTLAAQRPYGASVEIALAPDTNINRATSSDTLETVIGDFELSEDARARSGLGLSTKASAFLRLGIEPGTDLLLRANGYGRFYRQSAFNDMVASLQAGPQYRSGSDRISLLGSASWRWFGTTPYSFGYGVSGDWTHPLSITAQLRVDGSAIHTDDRLNALRSADRLSLGLGVDKALSARTGGGVRLGGVREFANDPGYSTASGGIDAYIYREIGSTTAVLRAGYDHLEADARLFLYPRRRIDDRVNASLSGTFRALRVGKLAPQLALGYEKSFSTIALYDYSRLSAEIGIVAAF